MTGATGQAGVFTEAESGTTSAALSTTASATQYFALNGSSAPSATTTNGNLTVNTAGTLSGFSVSLTAAPGGGNTRTFTVMVNGVASVITCAISGAGGGNTTCNSASTVNLTAGQTVNVRMQNGASTTTAATATVTATFTNGRGIG